MKIIDAHVHVGLNEFCKNEKPDTFFDYYSTYSDFINLMDKNNIEKAIILPIPHKDFDAGKSNDYLIEAFEAFPDKFIPFCRIDEKIEENFKRGFKGVKVNLVYEETTIDQIQNTLLFLESINAPILIHALFKNKVNQIERALEIAPNLKIILAHMGRWHMYTSEYVIENVTGLKNYNNVYFETSTVGDPAVIEETCNIVGDDRVIYGSDYPVRKEWFNNKIYEYYDEVAIFEKVGLKAESIEKILYSNIYNLLNLEAKS